MKSGRGMPPLLTTRSWILRSIWRMLSTSQRTLSHSRSTWRAEKRICISSAEIFFCSSRYFLRLVAFLLQHRRASACTGARIAAKRSSAATLSRSRFSAAIAPLSASSSSSSSQRVLVVHRLELLVEVHQPVDEFVDLELVLLDLAGELEDLRDRRRAGRDRHDHVLQAFLDALGDLDLAFAGEELDRAHLAHVHAHRVGGAAEFGVERRYRGLGASSSTSSAAVVGAASDISSVSASGASS